VPPDTHVYHSGRRNSESSSASLLAFPPPATRTFPTSPHVGRLPGLAPLSATRLRPLPTFARCQTSTIIRSRLSHAELGLSHHCFTFVCRRSFLYTHTQQVRTTELLRVLLLTVGIPGMNQDSQPPSVNTPLTVRRGGSVAVSDDWYVLPYAFDTDLTASRGTAGSPPRLSTTLLCLWGSPPTVHPPKFSRM
jgi:hypothetical protein